MTQVQSFLYEKRDEYGNRQFLGTIHIDTHFGKEKAMEILKRIEEKTGYTIE